MPNENRAGPANHRPAVRNAATWLSLAVILSALIVLLQSAPLVRLPFEIDYGEGLMLEGALRIHDHQPLYPSPYGFPVVLHDWGPVAYVAATLALPGGQPSYPSGRVLVVIASIALAALVGVLLKRWTGSSWIAIAFGLVLLTLPGFRFWLYLFRIDVIAIVFSVLGLLLYDRNEKRWFWAVPWFVLAIFSKYTVVAAPLAVFSHLLLKRRTRDAIAFAAAMSLACLLIFAILQATSGGWFVFHMFSTHSDRYSILQFFALAGLVWLSAPLVSGLAVWQVAQDFRMRQWSLASIYFAASCVTSLSAGQFGSTTNHFLEWMVASCMCAGLGFAQLAVNVPKRLGPIAVLLSVSVLMGVVLQSRSKLQPTAGLADCAQAYSSIRTFPSKAILAQNPGPLVVTGKPVMVSDPFVYTHLVMHGRWPDTRIEQLVKQRYFGLIVMADDPSAGQSFESTGWPDPLRNAITTNYHVGRRFVCRSASVMLEPNAPAAGAAQPNP